MTTTTGTATEVHPCDSTSSRPDLVSVEHRFSLGIRLYNGYTQIVDFGIPEASLLAVDEPEPLGHGRGPNPARLLGAAIGSCLGASLLFCLRKARIAVDDLETTVEGTLSRNFEGRLRVSNVHVTLSPKVDAEDADRMARCVELFERFCVVTESIRDGIQVTVDVA